jgi:hypothetical protein
MRNTNNNEKGIRNWRKDTEDISPAGLRLSTSPKMLPEMSHYNSETIKR